MGIKPSPPDLTEVRKAVHAYQRAAPTEVLERRRLAHDAIRAALHAGARQAAIVHATGLGRATVSRIARSGSPQHTPLPAYVPVRYRLPAPEVIARYKAGESTHALANAYGCSPGPIVSLLKQHHVPIRPLGRIDLPVPIEEVIRRYRDDREEIQHIAAEIGVAPYLLSRRMAEAGFQVPVGHRRQDLPDKEIVDRYQAGEQVSELAAEFKVSKRSIYWRLHEAGIHRVRQNRAVTHA